MAETARRRRGHEVDRKLCAERGEVQGSGAPAERQPSERPEHEHRAERLAGAREDHRDPVEGERHASGRRDPPPSSPAAASAGTSPTGTRKSIGTRTSSVGIAAPVPISNWTRETPAYRITRKSAVLHENDGPDRSRTAERAAQTAKLAAVAPKARLGPASLGPLLDPVARIARQLVADERRVGQPSPARHGSSVTGAIGSERPLRTHRRPAPDLSRARIPRSGAGTRPISPRRVIGAHYGPIP